MIRVFRSNMAGAPLLNGTQGSLLAVLDACLINGFGAAAPTQITRVGSTVTVGYIAPHNYAALDWVTFAGADQPEYNGSYRVTRIDALTLSYQIDSEPATPGTSSGAFASKRTSAGFVKPFEGLNKAVYQSTNPRSNKQFLRVSDEGLASSGARYAMVCAYEQMFDVDTGKRRFPSLPTAPHPDGAYWMKSNVSDASGRSWALATDGITFYIQLGTRNVVADFGNNTYSVVHGFGQLTTVAPDAYASFLSCSVDQNDGYGGGVMQAAAAYHNPGSKTAPIAVARNYAGSGTVWGVPLIGHGFGDQTCLGQGSYLTYPQKGDNRFYMCPVVAYESDGGVYVRGRMPGAFESPHGITHASGAVLETTAIVGMEGHRFMFMWGRGNSSYGGGFWLDIDGPWSE